VSRAIVDVDGTLWDMWTPVRDLLDRWHNLELSPHPPVWDYHREFVTDAEFYKAVRAAHAVQILHNPFKGAYLLFDSLNKMGWEVIVASHRPPQTAHRLVKWLHRHGLEPYSGVYCGRNKHFLIGAGDLVIDDNPDTIIFAGRAGAQALSLSYKYNQEALRKPFAHASKPVAFPNLQEIAEWVRTR